MNHELKVDPAPALIDDLLPFIIAAPPSIALVVAISVFALWPSKTDYD